MWLKNHRHTEFFLGAQQGCLFSNYMSVWGQIFFIYFNQNNILQEIESDENLSSIKPDIRDLQKC